MKQIPLENNGIFVAKKIIVTESRPQENVFIPNIKIRIK
jgi:hypothetical protein